MEELQNEMYLMSMKMGMLTYLNRQKSLQIQIGVLMHLRNA
jgi:hypothetical protein